MPSSKNYVRDYKTEAKYHATEEQKKNRAARNTARRQAAAKGQVKKGDGKDVDHKKPLSKGGSNGTSNRRVVSKSTNRSYERTKKGAVK
jgi:hypothetical protein